MYCLTALRGLESRPGAGHWLSIHGDGSQRREEKPMLFILQLALLSSKRLSPCYFVFHPSLRLTVFSLCLHASGVRFGHLDLLVTFTNPFLCSPSHILCRLGLSKVPFSPGSGDTSRSGGRGRWNSLSSRPAWSMS